MWIPTVPGRHLLPPHRTTLLIVRLYSVAGLGGLWLCSIWHKDCLCSGCLGCLFTYSCTYHKGTSLIKWTHRERQAETCELS